MRKLVLVLSASALKELFGRNVVVLGASADFGNVELDVSGIGPDLSDAGDPPVRFCHSLSDFRAAVNGGPKTEGSVAAVHSAVP